MRFIAKKTLTLITDSGNHYLAKVKGNQPRLLRAIEAHVSKAEPIDCFTTDERSRGRKERRHVQVYSTPNGLDSGWPLCVRCCLSLEAGSVLKARITVLDTT